MYDRSCLFRYCRCWQVATIRRYQNEQKHSYYWRDRRYWFSNCKVAGSIRAISAEFANASGLYFDNDIGQFTTPHPDALDADKIVAIVVAIESVLARI